MCIMKFLLFLFALGLCMKMVIMSGKISGAFHVLWQLALAVLVRLQQKKVIYSSTSWKRV